MEGLNPRQRDAVEALDGPLLVIAGAGSGKTRVLTCRIARLLETKRAYPENILAVTFTNKAAREMQDRIVSMLGQRAYQLRLSTFHSACVRILRKEIEILGYDPQFVIYDDHDQLTLIRQCLKRLNVDESQFTPRMVQGQIEKIKNRAMSLEDFLKKGISLHEKKVGQIIELYQSELKKGSALDFGDLISLTVHIFKKHPKILQKYRDQFRYCLVDEYQDTNHVQYLLMKLLCEEHQNLCVVGDEDQSIYSWRGADISNILSFEKDFPKAKVIKLEQNYRSTKTIIEASSHLIANNRNRKPKKLWTENGKGSSIRSVRIEDEYEEARFVAQRILKQIEEGETLSGFAIFYRTNAQSRVFEEVLREYRIPYQIFGGIHFYGRAEIKDMLGYMKLISNPKDNVSFLRIVNVPARGIGKVTLEKVARLSEKEGCSFFEAARLFSKQDDRSAPKLKEFVDKMGVFIDKSKRLNLQALYHEIIDQTRYVEILKEEKTIEALSRIENLEELDSAFAEFIKRHPEATLERYLEEISLVSDIDTLDETEEFVKMMTFHSAKGLEFPTVFMVGMEEGLFPYHRVDLDLFELEEERRLCYVGMTRARKNLYLTHATSRRVHGSIQFNLPSRFLDEMPKECIEKDDLRRSARIFHRRRSAKRGRLLTNSHSEGASATDSHSEGALATEESLTESDFSSDSSFDDDFNQSPPKRLFSSGERVHHSSFGRGVICRVEGEEEHTKLTIKFDSGYVKKFLAAQSPLQKLAAEIA